MFTSSFKIIWGFFCAWKHKEKQHGVLLTVWEANKWGHSLQGAGPTIFLSKFTGRLRCSRSGVLGFLWGLKCIYSSLSLFSFAPLVFTAGIKKQQHTKKVVLRSSGRHHFPPRKFINSISSSFINSAGEGRPSKSQSWSFLLKVKFTLSFIIVNKITYLAAV